MKRGFITQAGLSRAGTMNYAPLESSPSGVLAFGGSAAGFAHMQRNR